MPVSANLLSVTEDLEVVQNTIAEIQSDSTIQQTDLALLSKKFDELEGKLRFPGTKFLVDLEYNIVYDARIVINTSSTSQISIDTLHGELHAVYQLSAYATTNTPIILMDGASLGSLTDLGSLTNGVSVCLLRQRASDPTRIEIYLNVINSIASPQTLAIKVWRRLGIGS